MTTFDKSHRFNESTLNKKLDELDAWLQEIEPSPMPAAKKPVVHAANFNDSMYISEGSSRKSRNHLPEHTRPSQGALEAILSGPPQGNERKSTNPPRDAKDARRSKTSRFRRTSSRDKLKTMKEHSNESLSANGPRGGEGCGDDEIPKEKPSIIGRNRSIESPSTSVQRRDCSPNDELSAKTEHSTITSNERLSTSVQRGSGGSRQDELLTANEDSAIRRVQSNERLPTNAPRRKRSVNDELSAKSEHSTIRRNMSNERLSTSAQRGNSGSRQDELLAANEDSAIRRVQSNERLPTNAPRRKRSGNDELSAKSEHSTIRRNMSNERLSPSVQRGSGGSRQDELLAANDDSAIRRVKSNERLPINAPRRRQSSNDELSAKSEHSTIRHTTRTQRFSTSVQRGSGGSRQDELSAGSEHDIARRYKSSERLSTTAPLSGISNTVESLPGRIRRTSDPADLLNRRRTIKDTMAGDMQGKVMRRIGSNGGLARSPIRRISSNESVSKSDNSRIGSNGSLSREGHRSPVTRTKRDLLGGSEHSPIRRISSNGLLSKSDNSSSDSRGITPVNEHGLTRRIKSTENLGKGDTRTSRRSSMEHGMRSRRSSMEHGASRPRCSSTRNLTKGDQSESSRSDDDLGVRLGSQSPPRPNSRASSQTLLKSGNDELQLQECVTSGEDKHHHLSNNARRVAARTFRSKVGAKRSPKPSSDGYRGRPSDALTRALSVGKFFVTRCDSSEELGEVSKPESIGGQMNTE
jgi:hypothetical protein